MDTKIFINFRTVLQSERKNWDFTCAWAVFESTEGLSFEIEYVGPKRLFRKNPDNQWVNEEDIEIGYMNTPGEEDND